jgi:Uncharacterized protein conserved in bacteria
MDPIADAAAAHRTTAGHYRRFAETETDTSPTYRELALGAADDPEVIALIERLPERRRQVNLVFASARYRGAPMSGYRAFRPWLVAHWPQVGAVALEHTTQTNEAGRCAVLLPVLARIAAQRPGHPLALLEVGASAGLCLQPDRYSYRYSTSPDSTGPGRAHTIDPVDGPSSVVLECATAGAVPLPDRIPQVSWRAGIDLNPLDVNDPDDVAWLDALIWPEHEDRRARLRDAVRIAQADPPRIVTGDLNETLPSLAASAPAEATLVVFHTAVLAYLTDQDRARFVDTVASLGCRWISNEGVRVTPGVADRLGETERRAGEFVVALDGDPIALAQQHGRHLRWL